MQSWPRIAAGDHVLITAPTGSGKTLTAFLWAINRFATGACVAGATRVVYVSPLKALNNDIRANLLTPLGALRDRFAAAGRTFPQLRVQTRSGDTDTGERQRMLRRPPELLITTPESLNLMLTTVRGRQALGEVEAVILDEIHSLVENRRGVQLMTGLERLVELSGEFQRIALSATVRPLEAVAEYVGGFVAPGVRREVAIVRSGAQKQVELQVRFPKEARDAAENGEKIWEPLSDTFKDVIASNRSTLFFTNSRRMAEKITLKLNDQDALAPTAYAHHGSLSREVRHEVEARLKNGELRAIVATNSLEMGIDIGDLDEVVLIQSPPAISSALQRIGRAGHRVGEVSRGTLFPSHAMDFIDAAVIARAIEQRDIEPLRPIANALDVLAQIIVSCTVSEPWQTDGLYEVLRRATPYATLPREHFDLVVEMLAGRYADTRIRDLKPRLAFDRVRQIVNARKGAAFALYTSGGTIPDRGYFTLRHADSGTAIGELDEEFVWESSVGAKFTLGTQCWRVERITHNDVLVKPAPPGSTGPPFWRADAINRSFHFSLRVGEFLHLANEHLTAKGAIALHAELLGRGFDETAAEELVDFLQRQMDATECDLPHADHLLVEHILAGPGGYRGPDREQQVVLHTFWGGRVNRPIALALEAAWRGRFAGEPDVHADNNTIVIQLKEAVEPALVLSLVTPANFEALLRDALERSEYFGGRFRECAGRALLLSKRSFKRRTPLWMTRLQAKKLLTATKPLGDFPITLETWRTCLRDEFDMEAAHAVLERIASGDLGWSVATLAAPSPFAANVAFNQINRYMYADDSPERADRSELSDDLIRQAVFDDALRPKLTMAVIGEFESKVQRTRPGYAPDTNDELAEWVKERIAIPLAEWFVATPGEGVNGPLAIPDGVEIRPVAGGKFVVHREIDLGSNPPAKIADMLQFYGPRTVAQFAELLPFPNFPEIARKLVDRGVLVQGHLVADDDGVWLCDADNLETLIRFQRAAGRATLEARPATVLAPFLAVWHDVSDQRLSVDVLAAMDRLRGYRAPVGYWLDDAFQPRLLGPPFDELEAASVRWRGAGAEQLVVGLDDDIELVASRNARPDRPSDGARAAGEAESPDTASPSGLFRDPNAHYTFSQLLDASGSDVESFNDAFWTAVWRGDIAADGFQPLLAGRQRGFKLTTSASPAIRTGTSRRMAYARARMRATGAAISWPGTWYRVPADGSHDGETEALGNDRHHALAPDGAQLLGGAALSGGAPLSDGTPSSDGALSRLEIAKERCRMLLDRYGVLSRELANREGGVLRWSAVFPALRLMELSGEVVTGLFFEGLSGPQFALPQAVRQLERLEPAKLTCWISALDPISPCGLGTGIETLPQRRHGNHLGYFEGKLAVVSENFAKRLTIHLAVDDPGLDALLPNLVRLCALRKRLATEVINAEPARQSPYLTALARHLAVVKDHKGVYLELPATGGGRLDAGHGG